jgi:hypothetical protein
VAVPGVVEWLNGPPETGGSKAASSAAVQALSLIWPEGTAALVEIAADHPDPSTRGAARLAIGAGLGEPH